MTDFNPSPVRFALWDKQKKKVFIPPCDGKLRPTDYAVRADGVAMSYENWDDGSGGFYQDTRYIPLPSTGLKAKTKDGTTREIVEGDIVRVGMGVNASRYLVAQVGLHWYLSPVCDKRKFQKVFEEYYVGGSHYDFTILCHALNDEGKAMMNAEKKGRET